MAGERACPLSSTKAEAIQLIQLSLSMPRDLTTGMTAWRFEGTTTAERRRIPIVPPRANFMELFGRRSRRGTTLWWRRSRLCGRCRGGGLRLCSWIDPACMDAAVQAVSDLVVDRAAKADEATEGGLDVATGAAEAIVEIEMTESGIQIITPHQPDHTASEPDAFGIARRSVDRLSGFHEFGGLALAVPGCGCCGFCRVRLRLLRLILSAQIAALGNRGADSDQKRGAGHGDTAHGHMAKSGEKTTHRVPDQLPVSTFISITSG